MRYVAAYLLGILSGKEPGSSEIEKILGSVGIEVDSEKLQKVINNLKSKNIEELITNGRGKLASVPVGGATAVVGNTTTTPVTVAAAVEEKKEEKKKEESESEEDDDMGFGLFD